MRIKMKISYEACLKSKTIVELFLDAIIKAYKTLNRKSKQHRKLSLLKDEFHRSVDDFSNAF